MVHAGVRFVANAPDPRAVHLLWDGALAQIPIGLGTIAGRVTDDEGGAPIADASVLVTPPGGAFFQLATDADGTYGTLPLAPGDYDVSAVQTGFIPADAKVTVIPGKLVNPKDFQLKRTQSITVEGTVTAKGGPPLVAAAVTLVENSPGVGILTTMTGGDSGYHLKLDPGPFTGTYTISAGAAGFVSQSVTRTISDGATVHLDFELEPLDIALQSRRPPPGLHL
jgi:Carboxypeptidase regulatory-like domain